MWAVEMYPLRQSYPHPARGDFRILEHGTVLINCQLQRFREDKGVYRIVPTKNSKGRTIKPATAVMDLLKRQKAIQVEMRLKAGTAWENNDFVFTNECGHHFDNSTIYRAFKKAATAIGRPDARFHDLRHSYAVAASSLAMILRLCNQISVMQLLPLLSTFTVMSQSK